MNILLTNYCDRTCPFCFADEKLSRGNDCRKDISIDDLKIFLRFCVHSRVLRIGVLGGEPTLHPEFELAVETIVREHISFTLFTHGIIRRKQTRRMLQALAPEQGLLLVNARPPHTYDSDEYTVFSDTLRDLHEKTELGITLLADEEDLTFLIDLIKQYELRKKIRVGIAAPTVQGANRFVPIAQHRQVAQQIIAFAEECDREDIELHFDCGFLFCSFTEQEMGKLLRCRCLVRSLCQECIDVASDLTVWRCFGTSPFWNKKLSDFSTVSEIMQFYRQKFSPFHDVGVMPACAQCRFLRRGQCTGGCIAQKILLLQKMRGEHR